jgi:hypothetical protein
MDTAADSDSLASSCGSVEVMAIPNGNERARFPHRITGRIRGRVEWIIFSLYTVRIGGWGENMGGAALWVRVGFLTSLAARVLCASGRGASRALGMASALLQAGLWMVMINGL